MRALLALMGVLVLASCASVSREECLAGDWVSIGQRDGASGQDGPAQFSRHIRACEKVAVVPDQSAWARGYQQGLVRYCTPAVGLEEGLAGRSYRGVCPVATQARFLEGLNIGRAVYDQRQVISEIDSELGSLSRAAPPAGTSPDGQAAFFASNALEMRQLELTRLIERNRLMALEREVARYRAQLAAGG
ncbi:MAG: DUF2799 domain-containing protein [Roseinatronobacter sp.]